MGPGIERACGDKAVKGAGRFCDGRGIARTSIAGTLRWTSKCKNECGDNDNEKLNELSSKVDVGGST